MTSSVGSRDLPRPVLFAAGTLIVLALLVAAFGSGKSTDDSFATPIVASYELSLRSREDGSILPQLTDGRALPTIDAERAGFVSGVIRGLARGRKLGGVDALAPYRLTRLRDGRLMLIDTSTNTSIDVGLFGSDNARIFADLWRAADALAGNGDR